MPVLHRTPMEIIRDLDQRLQAGSAKLSTSTASYLFDLAGDGGGIFHIVVSDGRGSAGMGAVDNPDVTFSMTREVFTGLGSWDDARRRS